jgi:hypothetical protein
LWVKELNITARFARGAEITEVNGFSIAVERPAMEKHSVPALCAGTGNAAAAHFQNPFWVYPSSD